MYLNIVTNNTLLLKIKTIPYYKIDLGNKFRHSKRGHNNRIEFENPFIENYYSKNGRLLMKSGTIGIINIYTDYNISYKAIHIYNNNDLFEFEFNDNDYIKSGNMQKYLGKLLKKIENDFKVKLPSVSTDDEEETENKNNKKSEGNTKRLIMNPGSVNWDDLEAYKKQHK